MAEEHVGSPQWTPRAQATSRPRGLLDELIEEGSLEKDFGMPGHTYRVATKIHCDERACLYRTAVSCDGVEMRQEPWSAVFCNLAGELGAEGLRPGLEARRELARLALEAHLAVCTRVGETLERQGGLVRPSDVVRKALIAVPVVLGVAAAIVVWRVSPGEVSETPPTGVVSVGAERLASALVAPVPEPVPSGQPASVPAAQAPATKSPEPPRERHPSSAPSARRERSATPAAVATASPEEPDPEPARERPVPPPPTVRNPWPFSNVVPQNHSKVRLEPGESIYFAGQVRLDEVPPRYRGMRCVTTRDEGGDAEQAIRVGLVAPSGVVVAHDVTVKRRPDWLEAFVPTGDLLKATDMSRGGAVVTYALFEDPTPRRSIELGANTGATAVGRIGKRFAGRATVMYLVCALPEGR